MKIGNHDCTKDGVYVIAEAGVNHNGSIQIAKQLVEAAADAGAHAVKFQMFNTDALVTETAGLADYQRRSGNKTQKEMLAELELSAEQFAEIKRYCDQQNITFLATPFDAKSAEVLQAMNVDAFKISSGDLTYLPLLKQIAAWGKPMILSTGMAAPSEIDRALKGIHEVHPSADVALLHCTSSYPAPFHTLHLRAMQTLALVYHKPVGFSDHSEGIDAPIAAAALGANIIEKHFTLSREMKGPDHKASLEPKELKRMCEAIRNVAIALGNPIKKMTENEKKVREKVRRSIYAANHLPTGHIIREEDLRYLRPLDGIEVIDYDQVIGKRLVHSKKKNEPLYWDDLDGEEKP